MGAKVVAPAAAADDDDVSKETLLDNDILDQWVKLCCGGTKEGMDAFLKKLGGGDARQSFARGTFGAEGELSASFSGFRVFSLMSVAVAKLSLPAIQVLLDNGADLLQADKFGNNLVHLMICCAVMDRDLEDQFIDLFTGAMDLLTPAQKRDVLLQENQQTLRPLEMAAEQGVFKFTLAIFESKDVYVTVVNSSVTGKRQLYDITEYESGVLGTRCDRSPLRFFSYMDISNMDMFAQVNMSKEFLKQWIYAKSRVNFVFVILWFLARLFQLLAFVFLDVISVAPYVKNTTCNNMFTDIIPAGVSNTDSGIVAMAVIVFIYTLLSIILDLAEMIKFYATKESLLFTKTLHGSKSLVVQEFFYRGAHMLTNILIIIGLIQIYLINDPRGVTMDFTRLIAPALMTWSLFYFFQVVPAVGRFIISMQRMISSLIVFFIVYFLMVLPFMIGFSLIIASHSAEDCVPGFGFFLEGIYTTFCLMLSIVNFIDMSHTPYPFAIWLLHILFVFAVAILLLNFLIAIMSESVATLSDNIDAVISIQRIALLIRVEHRLGRLMGAYYSWSKGKLLHMKGEKMYLQTIDSSFIGNGSN